MNAENALKLARKVGTPKLEFESPPFVGETMWQRWGVELGNGNVVTFGLANGALKRWAWFTRNKNGDLMLMGNATTFARTLALAAYTQHKLGFDERKVTIETGVNPFHGCSRFVNVTIHDCVVVGRHDEIVALADKAIETNCPAGLLDWVEEHCVEHNPAANLILV